MLRFLPVLLTLFILLLPSIVPAQETNALGRTLPDDAAPLAQQKISLFESAGTYMEWFKTIYRRCLPGTPPLTSEPLVRMDKNAELMPAGATSWEPGQDGNSWYFHLRPGMQWSDGRAYTAHDYVYSFMRGADPENAYDFEWYYRTIKNWSHVVGRRMPMDSLGLRAIDDLTLEVKTEQPVPYLPYNMIQSWATPKQAVDKYGHEWSTRAEWSVSSGPFYLHEWKKNDQVILRVNPQYRGATPPYLEELVFNVYSQAGQPQILASYEAGEVDMILLSGQAEMGRVKSDPALKSELHSAVAFITYYLTMNTLNPPFNDLRVRQAFGHAVDRQALLHSALKDVGVAAYGMLPPGFPGADPDALKEVRRYDPERARALLSEAGYPEGRGFPQVDIWLRTPDAHTTRVPAEAIQAMVADVLNIEVGVRVIERKVFSDGLNNQSVPLALVAYSQDYPDPSNLLGIWLWGGRHAWRDDVFERLVRAGNVFMGSTSDRFTIYQAAERRLVEEVGGLFLWHPIHHRLWKPYIKSPDLAPNRQGNEVWGSTPYMTGYITDKTESVPSPTLIDRLRSWFIGDM